MKWAAGLFVVVVSVFWEAALLMFAVNVAQSWLPSLPSISYGTALGLCTVFEVAVGVRHGLTVLTSAIVDGES